MKECRLKDICIKGSSNLKQKDVEGKKGLYPVYGASGKISSIDIYHQENEYIAIVKDGSGIGRVSFMPPKSSVIGTMQYILPKEGYNIRYIGYCLQSLGLNKYKQGAAIPHIYFRDYGERIVKVSEDIEEQRRIVSYLDSSFQLIDKIKEKAQKSLLEAKALFQSALAEAMEPKEGWEEKTLPDVSDNLDNLRKPVTKNKREKGIYPYYGASGIVDYVSNYLINDTVLLISEDGANLIARSTPIAFSVSGKIWVNNHAHILKFSNMTTQLFVEYYFSSINIEEYVTGAAQPKLTQKNLNKIIIPYPPLSTQKQIVSHLDKLSSNVKQMEEKYQKIVEECDALKQAMLRDVFE